MSIVINSNAAATEATFNLSKNNENLRRSIARLSSGNRITKPTDDAGGLAVAYKLNANIKRTEASLNNHQNALSYLQVQDGVLEVVGEIVDRMAELRTLASDVTKNTSDVENYSKEFLELQDQLHQLKREKFNGVELFAVDKEWDQMQGMNKGQLFINNEEYTTGKASFGSKEIYQYFDHPQSSQRTETSYDKYELQLLTHPSGVEHDGDIKLNVVNLQYLLGIKNPVSFGLTAPSGTGLTGSTSTNPLISIGQTVNLAGLYPDSDNDGMTDLPTDGTNQASSLMFKGEKNYIRDILDISVEEFTNIIEKVADARAENGAEQQRITQSISMHQNNLVNLQAAHGRIMDVDVAMESTRLARHSVTVQASAAMVSQANQMTAIALTLLQ